MTTAVAVHSTFHIAVEKLRGKIYNKEKAEMKQ